MNYDNRKFCIVATSPEEEASSRSESIVRSNACACPATKHVSPQWRRRWQLALHSSGAVGTLIVMAGVTERSANPVGRLLQQLLP